MGRKNSWRKRPVLGENIVGRLEVDPEAKVQNVQIALQMLARALGIPLYVWAGHIEFCATASGLVSSRCLNRAQYEAMTGTPRKVSTQRW